MSIKKLNVVVKSISKGKEKIIYKTTWDGNLDDWIDIGGECAGVIDESDGVTISLKPASKGRQK